MTSRDSSSPKAARIPGANALGAIDDVELTRAVGRALGADLARVGLDLELAPVADVNSDPLNPVIGIRSFGDDPDLVARHVAAFTQGLQEVGVAGCAKHFPGHGATRVDSHVGLPVVDIDRATLLARELVPFRAAIAAGVQVDHDRARRGAVDRLRRRRRSARLTSPG